MKNSNPAVRIVAWILLLFASTVQMATTPLDEWTTWTFYSLLVAVGCIVMLIVDFTKWKKSKQG
jgi:hypothetical protein